MKQFFEFIWRVALTPFYLVFLSAASVFVLLADGKEEFTRFWKDNT